MIRVATSALLIAVTVGWAQADTLRLAQRNYYPTEVCANQVAQRFNLPWFDVETRQDRHLGDGAVLVNWRTARDSGYCEVSARGDLLRFVVESSAGIGRLDDNPQRICIEEVARQRNVSRDAVKAERRSTDRQGRVTVAWYTRHESGFCEVSNRGRVDYFKVTQSEPDYRGAYRDAEQLCRRTVADKRQVPKSDVSLSRAEASGKRIRVDWETRYESGYCEIDRRGRLRQFHVTRQDRPHNTEFRKQERVCALHIGSKLNVKTQAVQIVSSQAVGGLGAETVRVDWRVRRRNGYCLFRRDIMIDSSLR